MLRRSHRHSTYWIIFIDCTGSAIEKYDLNIFDRWGGKMHQSANINQPWEGKVNGGYEAPQGAYVYVIIVKDVKGVEHEYTGTVTLIR